MDNQQQQQIKQSIKIWVDTNVFAGFFLGRCEMLWMYKKALLCGDS